MYGTETAAYTVSGDISDKYLQKAGRAMPEITVTKPFLPDIHEYEKIISEIWKHNWLTNDGPILLEFQKSLEGYIDNSQIVLTANGHMALEIAIRSLGYMSGEVITTPFTFASTVHAISMNNLTPVFCDINRRNLTIDADKLEALITEQTKAILPVHVYGHPCDIEKIESIAEKHGIEVIYDAAHTFGERYKNKSLSNYGYASIYSFHATKLFHTIEGGAIVYRDSDQRKTLEALRNFGITGETSINYVGGNAKMNEFEAAMGLVNLKHIKRIIEERMEITLRYREQLSTVPGIEYFEPDADSDLTYNYAYFPILVHKAIFKHSRDELYSALKKEKIFTRRYFYPLVCDARCYKDLPYSNVPTARLVAESVLCLPIYNGLEIGDVDRICSIIKKLGGTV